MKADELKIGEYYSARVSQRFVIVRLDSTDDRQQYRGSYRFGQRSTTTRTVYNVTNMNTGRELTFSSAAKFRRKATQLELDLADWNRNKPQ